MSALPNTCPKVGKAVVTLIIVVSMHRASMEAKKLTWFDPVESKIKRKLVQQRQI